MMARLAGIRSPDEAKRNPGPRAREPGFRFRFTRATTSRSFVNSVRREAIEQPVTAGALQIGLRAAAVRAARRVRGVPGFRGVIVTQAHTIGMTDHRRALCRARPVLAGAILARRKR